MLCSVEFPHRTKKENHEGEEREILNSLSVVCSVLIALSCEYNTIPTIS